MKSKEYEQTIKNLEETITRLSDEIKEIKKTDYMAGLNHQLKQDIYQLVEERDRARKDAAQIAKKVIVGKNKKL